MNYISSKHVASAFLIKNSINHKTFLIGGTCGGLETGKNIDKMINSFRKAIKIQSFRFN